MDLTLLEETLLLVGRGALAGGVAAFMGYMKQEELGTSWYVILTKKFWEKFDPLKALKTVIIGTIVGSIGAYFGYDYATTGNHLADIGVMSVIIYGVDGLIKLIVRRTPIIRAWNWLKNQFSGFTI